MCSLGKTLLAFALLHFVLKAKFACYSRYPLTSYFCIPVPCDEKDIFFGTSVWYFCQFTSFKMSDGVVEERKIRYFTVDVLELTGQLFSILPDVYQAFN